MFCALVLAAAMTAPMDYQIKTFATYVDEDGARTGELSVSQLSCVESRLGELGVDTVGDTLMHLVFVRNDDSRNDTCMIASVERSEPIEAFIGRDAEPSGARFSTDGSTAFYRATIERQCVPRGRATALAACIDGFLQTPGRVTELVLRRDDSTKPMVLQYAWELWSGAPAQYAVDRRAGIARSHVREIVRPKDGEGF